MKLHKEAPHAKESNEKSRFKSVCLRDQSSRCILLRILEDLLIFTFAHKLLFGVLLKKTKERKRVNSRDVCLELNQSAGWEKNNFDREEKKKKNLSVCFSLKKRDALNKHPFFSAFQTRFSAVCETRLLGG